MKEMKEIKPIKIYPSKIVKMINIICTPVLVIGHIVIYLLLFLVKKDFDDIVIINAIVGCICIIIALPLISIPIYLSYYPRWVVAIYGEDYLRKLIKSADLFFRF